MWTMYVTITEEDHRKMEGPYQYPNRRYLYEILEDIVQEHHTATDFVITITTSSLELGPS